MAGISKFTWQIQHWPNHILIVQGSHSEGEVQYAWPPNKISDFILKILFTFDTQQANLMRRSIVLILLLTFVAKQAIQF
jgi:hypothetical protein